MRYSETRQLFEQAFEFPADRDTVVEQLGDVELTAPTGDTVTVGTTLNRIDETNYRSADALYSTLIGSLEEDFVGRKNYDDRGGTAPEVDGDGTLRSF